MWATDASNHCHTNVLVPWNVSPIPFCIRQKVVIRAGVTCCHHFGRVALGLKFWPQHRITNTKKKQGFNWKKNKKQNDFLNHKATVLSIILGFLYIFLELPFCLTIINFATNDLLLLTKRCWWVPPSSAKLVLGTRKASSRSPGGETSCRNAVGVQDWASLSFWLISGAKNSATSTVQWPSVNSWCQWRSVSMWLSALYGCSTPSCWPAEKDSKRR